MRACIWIFIYKGTKMKLGSVCRAKQMLQNGSTPRSLANFYTELERFLWTANRAFTLILNSKKAKSVARFSKIRISSPEEIRTSIFFPGKYTTRTKKPGKNNISGHLCAELHGLQGVVVGQKNSFFEISLFEQQIFKNKKFFQRVQNFS